MDDPAHGRFVRAVERVRNLEREIENAHDELLGATQQLSDENGVHSTVRLSPAVQAAFAVLEGSPRGSEAPVPIRDFATPR